MIQCPDSTFKNLLLFSKPLFNENQNLTGAHSILIDISGQVVNEIKQTTLSAIVESSDDAIISKDLRGKITSWNKGAEMIFGFTEKETLGKSITMLIPMERLKEEKQAMLSAIVNSSEDAIISKDLTGKITSWNKGAEIIFGFTEKETLGKSITILIPKDRLKEEKHIIDNIKKGKKVDHFETVRKTKDGRLIPLSITVSPVKDFLGNIVGASKVARDISARIQAEAEINQHNSNLEILNSIGKSISENLDVQGVLQRVTDATTKLTGASYGAFFYNDYQENGESFKLYTLSGAARESFEKLGMPRHTALFAPTFADKEVVRIDDILLDPRYGKNFPQAGMPAAHLPVRSYLAVPVVSKTGEVIGGLLFGHPEPGIFTASHEDIVINIAAQAAVSLDNSKLFEQVKNLSDRKDEFIALASHELKTPLTTIKGYLQVLAKKEKDSLSELFISKSLNQVNKLNNLVDDLLNMSRIEAGKMEFNLEVFDLSELLREIAETFLYSHTSHSVLLKIDDYPVMVNCDRPRIEQAIINLLSNAIKYSPGAEKVYMGLNIQDRFASVYIRDEGTGLTREQQRQLFTRFYRAENTKGISGLGLGLYLTRQIIENHNGEVGVKSKYGEGSEFFFTLPLEENLNTSTPRK
ncbi:PAS domain S-box protein [Antarcticibacterium arcticum]|uniref:histidine kinase n=2 Tax=Antarcticibacterium arcticum TaxID=2585771 RepID=A0A5B8YP54_9FLAO|nr:PAS domain S-box protein [Antarcticibacterium arcticum]